MLALAHPLGLLLLPLALLPFLARGADAFRYSALAMLPPDPLSRAVELGLRCLAAACVVALALGVSGLHRVAEDVERIGQGAQTVILIDNSGSMDEVFATGNEHRSRASVWGTYTSKGQVARRLLADYVGRRPQDMFALYVFSANPIAVLPLTPKQDAVQAALAAGSIERGLASTDLGNGLIQALQYFAGRPFTGSRIVLLVSDGAARLAEPVQDRIKKLLEQHRVTLYWLYLRGQFAPGLYADTGAGYAEAVAPEQIVHRFFSEMGLPYRAFSAEDPKALEAAIAEVDKLQNLPMRYTDVIPQRDLSGYCYAAGFALMVFVLGARAAERTAWA